MLGVLSIVVAEPKFRNRWELNSRITGRTDHGGFGGSTERPLADLYIPLIPNPYRTLGAG
jgi:hypothetical protein